MSELTKIHLYELIDDPKEWFKDASPGSIETIILYHGTSSLQLKPILSEGLKPRKETGVSTWGELDWASIPNRVYLASRIEAEEAGRIAVIYHAYRNNISRIEVESGKLFLVLIEVETDVDNLVPGEDSHMSTWYESLMRTQTCAYKGVIPPQGIRKIWKSPFPFEHYELTHDFTKPKK